jgi:hypothetical protein
MTTSHVKWTGLLLVAATVYFVVAEVDSLTCDRDGSGTCTVAHGKIYRFAEQSFGVAELTGAGVEEYPTTKPRKGDDVPGMYIVVHTTRGPVPLMNHASGIGVSEMEDEAWQIRRFATDATIMELEIEHTNRGIAFIAGALAAMFGGAILLAGSRHT